MNRQSDIKKNTLRVPSEIKHVKKVSSDILKSLSSGGLDESVLFDIRLCVEEMVRNAIVHGNNNDNKLKVTVSYWLEGNKLIIEVEDEGRGFDSNKLPDPTTDENLTKGSGRGVYIARKLMDKMEFNDKGNKVRLTKYLR